MIYFTIFVLLIVLSFQYDLRGKNRGKNLWIFITLALLIIISGMRYRLGVDTANYLYNFYHKYPSLGKFELENFMPGEDPLFVLINSIIISLGGRFYIFQFIHAIFVNGLIYKYVIKHTPYIFTTIAIYFIWKYFAFNMEEMRASMSVVVCLFANDYILEKKYFKAIVLYVIGSLFHASTLLLLIMPFLYFLRLNIKGAVMLVGAFIIGGILMELIGDNLMLFQFNETISNKATGYVNSESMSGQMGNLNYFVINIIPYILYSLYTLLYMKRYKPEDNLLKLEPLLMCFMLFMVLQSQIYIFYRIAEFYSVYLMLFSSAVFVHISKGSTILSRTVSLTRATLVFSYLIFAILFFYKDKEMQIRYTPYTSIIDLKIVTEREKVYMNYNAANALHNEY